MGKRWWGAKTSRGTRSNTAVAFRAARRESQTKESRTPAQLTLARARVRERMAEDLGWSISPGTVIESGEEESPQSCHTPDESPPRLSDQPEAEVKTEAKAEVKEEEEDQVAEGSAPIVLPAAGTLIGTLLLARGSVGKPRRAARR